MTLTDFLDYILPDVPGCPSPVASRAALRAATDFLSRSQAWVEVQDPIAVVANQQEYELDAPSGARVIDVLAIHTRAGELMPLTLDQLPRVYADWQTVEGNVPAHYTRGFDFTTFRVYPKPTEPNGETLRVQAVYTLRDTATAIPDEIVRMYGEAIASGAKERLMTMPGVAWKDLQLAQYHATKYQEGLNEARIRSAMGNTLASVAARPRRFGQ